MTRLSLAARNTLAQDDVLKTLIPRSKTWDIWIFDEKPILAKFESTGQCLVVINEGPQWTSPNDHNTLEFPTLVVDIWADPDRNPDRTIKDDNAKDKIKVIAREIDRHFHRVDPGGPDGGYIIWGTATEIASKTGQLIVDSKKSSGPDFSEIAETEKAWMGRYIYDVSSY